MVDAAAERRLECHGSALRVFVRNGTVWVDHLTPRPPKGWCAPRRRTAPPLALWTEGAPVRAVGEWQRRVGEAAVGAATRDVAMD